MSDMTSGKSKAGARGHAPHGVPATLSRRAALLSPLALAGCETIEGWFSTKKEPAARQAGTSGRAAARLRGGRDRAQGQFAATDPRHGVASGGRRSDPSDGAFERQ